MPVTAQMGAEPVGYLKAQTRWGATETLFWLATLLPFYFLPDYLQLASQIAIIALFALSLDLILGYAGIVSLGHAAFFGTGAYAAGLFSKFVWGEPLTGLIVGAIVAGLVGYATSFIIARFRHFALIMLTLGFGLLLGAAANSASWLTGGSDGLQGVNIWPLLGRFNWDLYGYTAYGYSLVVLFVLFLFARRVIHSPFGLALRGIRENLAAYVGDRRAEPRAYPHRLYDLGGDGGGCRRAYRADHPNGRARFARTSSARPKS